MVVCIVYLLVDARKRRTPRNRTILWVVGAALVYYCVFPLYLFLRQGTRTFIAIPASLALTFVMAFALFAPSYTNDDEQSDQTAGMAKDTSQRLTDSKGASVSVTEVEQKLNIKFSRMAKFKVKGIYLGMNKSDAINIMKKLLGKENVGYDESNPGMVMLNGGGASSAPSAMMFAGDPLIGYAFQSDVVDRIFNAGALDFRSFAQQFIDNYNLGKMTAERDEHGSEYLIHRNKAGFSVQIFADKSMGVALIENAGKPSFN